MNEKNHLEKELLFKNNIKEITSISLDSNYKVNNNEIMGDFLIDGEYKIHELSINKEKFNYKIPFRHEIDTNYKKDSIILEIDNFTYDFKNDELIVNIDYTIKGDKEDIIEFSSKDLLDEYLRDNNVDVIEEQEEESKQENEIVEPTSSNDIVEDNLVDRLEIPKIKEERNVNLDNILDNVDTNNDFIIYKVHKLNSNDTLESIVIKYHTSIDELKECNDLNNFNELSKIIIPKYE